VFRVAFVHRRDQERGIGEDQGGGFNP
jgi:hypothetical protein